MLKKLGSFKDVLLDRQILEIVKTVTNIPNPENVRTVGNGCQHLTITDAVNWIVKNGVPSVTKRWVISVAPGVYNERVTLPGYIDIAGKDKDSCIVSWSGNTILNEDTIRVKGETSLSNLTVLHFTLASDPLSNYCYPIHIDTPLWSGKISITNVVAKAIGDHSHHALGMGLFANQSVHISSSTFHSSRKPAIYCHNWNSQPYPMAVEIKGCTVIGCVDGLTNTSDSCGMLIEDCNSNQPGDLVRIVGSHVETYAPLGKDIVMRPHGSFTGPRNFISVYCNNTLVRQIETSAGLNVRANIPEEDLWLMNTGTVNIPPGAPVTYYMSGQELGVRLASSDDSEHVVGAWLGLPSSPTSELPPGECGYIRTKGRHLSLKCDATIPIPKYSWLSTKANGCFKRGTPGSGTVVAMALADLNSGIGHIPAELVDVR